MNIRDLVPEFLLDTDFEIFIELANAEFNEVSDYISLINTLTNLDRCPEEFLQSLFGNVGMTLDTKFSRDLQRECAKLYYEERKKKGTLEAITMAATYGDNPGYLCGSLFIPGTYEHREAAVVAFPRDSLFRWSRSKWSGSDKRPGPELYREGVIHIKLTRLNRAIMNKVEEVRPAGMMVVYEFIHDGEVEIIQSSRVR